MNKLFIIILLSIPLPLLAQYISPNLGSGIENVVLQKGSIDIELLSNIITNQQNDLLRESLYRFLAKNTNSNSYAFDIYLKNIINLLLNENNKGVITRNMLEQTANFALLYTFAEFYLQTEFYLRNDNDSTFYKLINYCNSKPWYLSTNEQASAFAQINKTASGGQVHNILWNLKAGNKEVLEKELSELNYLIDNILNNDLYNELNAQHTIDEDFIRILKLLDISAKSNNNTFLKLQIKLNTLYINPYKSSTDKIFSSISDNNPDFTIIRDNLNLLCKNVYKNDNNYLQIELFKKIEKDVTELNRSFSFLYKNETNNDSNILNAYNYLCEKLDSIENYSKEPFLIDLLKFKKLMSTQTDSSENNEELKNLYQKLKKIYKNNSIDQLKNDYKKITDILHKKSIINELSSEKNSITFGNWEKFVKTINPPKEELNDYIQWNAYDNIMKRKQNYENLANYEILQNQFYKLYSNANSLEETTTSFDYPTPLYNDVYTIKDSAYNQNLLNLFKTYQNTKDTQIKLTLNYKNTIETNIQEQVDWNFINEIQKNNSNYASILSLADSLLNASIDNSRQNSILKSFTDKLIQEMNAVNEYIILQKKIDTVNFKQNTNDIKELYTISEKLNNLSETKQYEDLSLELKGKYATLKNVLYELGKLKENESLICNWKEYQNFTQKIAEYLFKIEFQWITKTLNNSPTNFTDISQMSEYKNLIANWRKEILRHELRNTISIAKKNKLHKNETKAFKDFCNSSYFNQFNEICTKYKDYIQQYTDNEYLTKNETLFSTLQNINNSQDIDSDLDTLRNIQKTKNQFTGIIKLRNLYNSIKNDGIGSISLNMLLLDMIYDICINSTIVKKCGFFVSGQTESDDVYKRKNTYLQLENTDYKLFELLTECRTNIQFQLELLFNYFQIIQEMKFFQGKSLEEIRENYMSRLIQSFENIEDKTEETKDIFEIRDSIIEVNKVFNEYNNYILTIENELNKIENGRNILQKIRTKNDYIPERNYIENFKNKQDDTDSDSFYAFVASCQTDEIIKNIELLNYEIKYTHNKYINHTFKRLMEKSDMLITMLRPLNLNIEISKEDEANKLRKTLDSVLYLYSEYKKCYINYKSDIIGNKLENPNYVSYFLQKFKQSLYDFNAATLHNDDKQTFEQTYKYISSLETTGANNIEYSFIRYFKETLIPKLVAININYGDKNTKNKIDINCIENVLNYAYCLKLNKFYDSKNIFSPKIMSLSSNFINIISKLNMLDDANTYLEILNSTIDAGNMLIGKKAAFTANQIINDISKYTSYNANNNTVLFDMESFINTMHERFFRVSKSPFSLYFTLGLNHSWFLKDKKFEDNSKTFNIPNLAFASEKIGVKYQIINYYKKRFNTNALDNQSFQPLYAPIVTDIHTILYGSGLLYNITNTTTNKNFNFPIYGLGFGVTFHNSLDLNITFSFPVVEKAFNYPMLGFSFDIKFLDYISEISRKRKGYKTK